MRVSVNREPQKSTQYMMIFIIPFSWDTYIQFPFWLVVTDNMCRPNLSQGSRAYLFERHSF